MRSHTSLVKWREAAFRCEVDQGLLSGANRTCATAAIADSANVRTCSADHFAVQHISPNRPFKRANLVDLKLVFRCGLFQQTRRGQKRAKTSLVLPWVFVRTKLLFCGALHEVAKNDRL